MPLKHKVFRTFKEGAHKVFRTFKEGAFTQVSLEYYLTMEKDGRQTVLQHGRVAKTKYVTDYRLFMLFGYLSTGYQAFSLQHSLQHTSDFYGFKALLHNLTMLITIVWKGGLCL